MSSEVKVLFKEARELFKQKEYINTIKKCKKILDKDKDNYRALILLAAAMQETDEYKLQALLALQKATEIEPDNPLAWRGIVSYYDKENYQVDGKNQSKVALAYCKILQLDSNSPKFLYFLDKISELSLQVKDEAILTQIIEVLDELRNIDDKEKCKMINKALALILTDNSLNLSKYQDLSESILATVIEDVDFVNRQDYYRRYLKLLYNKNKVTTLVKEAIKMHQQFPRDLYPLEYICRIYYEESFLNENDIDIDVKEYFDTLLDLDVESEPAAIAKAKYLSNGEHLVSARETLNQLLISKPQSFYAWLTLSDINARLYCWYDVESVAKRILQLRKHETHNKLLYNVQLKLLEAMSRSNNRSKWENASDMCKNLLKEEPSIELKLIYTRTSILLNNSDVNNELNDLESATETKVQANILRALHLKNQKRFEEAANVLDPALECSEAWLLLGQIYWEMGEYNHSLLAFLNGIKNDRYNWKCLVYLGHYYREYGNDIDRAKRCYQTALQINPNSEEAGIGLSTTYRILKNQDANIQLLQRLTMQDNGPKWAWLQLGLQHLDQGDAIQAIKAFQHVIRADPNDNHSWESLADAYLIRGAHTSALKSYQRALELCPDSLYPITQLANIKLIVGQYSEAKNDFERILVNEPYDIFALKGLAETCLGLAKENITKQFLGRARSNFQQAMDTLTVAVMKRGDLSCIWKLLGDVCYRTATLSEKYNYLSVTSTLIKSHSVEEYTIVKGGDMFLLATRCYCRALSLSSNSALLWHDLACCYFMQLQLDPSVNHTIIASKCLAAAKHAVKSCPTSWIHWNLLGVICMSDHVKNYALAQHAYIMAIDKELNNAVVWANLGTLYLHIGDLYKSNEAYYQAQRSDPAYVNSWVGQGLIAEKTSRKEAMDLFRHSTELGYHDQAAIGYAHWVVKVLLNSDIRKDSLYTYMIENMHAVSVAMDVLHWYTERNPNTCYARNAYGLLLEREKMYRSAREQFNTALQLSTNEEKDLVCINLVRNLIQLGRYNEAVELCRTIKKGNFISQCYLALSLFKAEQYEKSYSAYQAALNWFANTESEKANTLCAMAAMAHIFQVVADAKTLLFQCIQIKPIVPAGYLAAASLGILHGDFNLTTLVLEELTQCKNDPQYGHHIASLCAYSYLIQGKVKDAIIVLCKAIHRYPCDVRYWIRLLRMLLETNPKTFNKCAQKALLLSRNTNGRDIVHVACASSFEYFMQNLTTDGIRAVQKIFFMYPSNIQSWITFIAAFLPRCVDKTCKPDAKWLSEFILKAQISYHPKGKMAEWLHSSLSKVNDIRRITEIC